MKTQNFIFLIGLLLIAVNNVYSQYNHSVLYNYDNINRLTEVLYPNGTTIEYCYDELGNRECYMVTSSVPNQADIYLHDLSLNSTTLCQGSTFTITYQEENLGTAAAGGFSTAIVLSDNNTYEEESDIILKTRYTSGLASGASNAVSENVDLPENLDPGSYYVLIIADTNNVLDELSEDNNLVFQIVTISTEGGFDVLISTLPDTCDQWIGAATAMPSGGQSPYSFQWNTGQTTSTATQLASGTYYVSVTDDNGCEQVSSATVGNEGSLPAPSFTYSIDSLTVAFTNTTPNGDSFWWDFGDGEGSDEEHPVHMYENSGIYNIDLKTENRCGENNIDESIYLDPYCFDINMMQSYIGDTTISISFAQVVDSLTIIINKLHSLSIDTLKFFNIDSIHIENLEGSQHYICQLMVSLDCGTYNLYKEYITTDTYIPFKGNDFTKKFYLPPVGNGDSGISLLEVLDSIYIVSCTEDSFYISKVSRIGEEKWTKSISHNFDAFIAGWPYYCEIDSFIDHSVLFSFIDQDKIQRFYKFSADGETLWTRKLDINAFDASNKRFKIEIDNQDNILLFMLGREGSNYGVFFKFDKDGNKLWNKVYDHLGTDFPIIDFFINRGDSNYFACRENSADDDLVFFKLDSIGNVLWAREIQSITDQAIIRDFEIDNSDGYDVFSVIVDSEFFEYDGNFCRFCIDSSDVFLDSIIWNKRLDDFEPYLLDKNTLYGLREVEEPNPYGGTNKYRYKAVSVFSESGNLIDNYFNESFFYKTILFGSSQLFLTSDYVYNYFNLSKIIASEITDPKLDESEYCFPFEEYSTSYQNVTRTLSGFSLYPANPVYDIWDLVNPITGLDTLLTSTDYSNFPEEITCDNSCYHKASIFTDTNTPCQNQILQVHSNGNNTDSLSWYINDVYKEQFTNDTSIDLCMSQYADSIQIKLVSYKDECIDSTCKTLYIQAPLELDLIQNDITCLSRGEGVLIASVSNGNEPYFYSWNNGSTSSINENLDPGSYWVQVTDVNGCSDTKSITLGSDALIEQSDTTICPGDPVTLSIIDTLKSSVLFDENTDSLVVSHQTSLQITGNLTIICWIKPLAFDYERNVLHKASGGEYSISLNGDGTIKFTWGTSGSDSGPMQEFNSSIPLQLNLWNQVVLVRDLDMDQLIWYINGTLSNVAPTSFSQSTASTFDLIIGNGPLPHAYHGLIDEVSFWNAALDSTTLSNWKDKTLSSNHPYYINLKAYWKFDERNGSTVFDESLANHHGYFVHSPQWDQDVPDLLNSDLVWSNGTIGDQLIVRPLNTSSYSVSYKNGVCSDQVTINTDYYECPCTWVLNTHDAGDGSLRNAVNCSNKGDTVRFAPFVFGDTIRLTTSPINLEQDLSLVSEKANNIFIQAKEIDRVIQITAGTQVSIEGLKVICGDGLEGRCIYNDGVLTIRNVDLIDPNLDEPGNSVQNNDTLIFEGESVIKKE